MNDKELDKELDKVLAELKRQLNETRAILGAYSMLNVDATTIASVDRVEPIKLAKAA